MAGPGNARIPCVPGGRGAVKGGRLGQFQKPLSDRCPLKLEHNWFFRLGAQYEML